MAETLRDWLAEHPPPDGAFTQTLSGVAVRVRDGEDFRAAVREFLDEFALRPEEARDEAIGEPPPPTGERRHDAFLGALGEHLAATHGLEHPAWSLEPGRFLDRFWFLSDVKGFRAIQIAESPAAFRRRGIFLAEGALERR